MGRLTDERPRLQTGPGKFGRPALSGGLRKRSHGGNEIPTRNRKSGLGNPPPTAGASEFYPNQNARNRDSECNALISPSIAPRRHVDIISAHARVEYSSAKSAR